MRLRILERTRNFFEQGLFLLADIPQVTDHQKFFVIVDWCDSTQIAKFLVLNTEPIDKRLQFSKFDIKNLKPYEIEFTAEDYLFMRQRKCHACREIQLMDPVQSTCHKCGAVQRMSRRLNCWEIKEAPFPDTISEPENSVPLKGMVRLFREDIKHIVQLVLKCHTLTPKESISVAVFFKTALRGIQLEGAVLDGADLAGANLAEANLENVSMRGTCLEGADLTGARLRGAELHSASLRRANLRNADLTGANLDAVNLDGANLEGIVGFQAVSNL